MGNRKKRSLGIPSTYKAGEFFDKFGAKYSTGNKELDDYIVNSSLDSDESAGIMGGSLPEVIYNFSDNAENSKTLSKLREMFHTKQYIKNFSRNPIFRNGIRGHERNYTISDNDVINRVYDIYSASNKPNVTHNRSLGVNILGGILFNHNKYRPNYNVITNTIHLPSSFNDTHAHKYWKKHRGDQPNINNLHYIAELSHAYQYNSNNTNNYTKLSIPGDIKINGKTGYHRKNHLEYEAHSIIEPNIYDYVLGNIDYKTFINNIKNKNVLKYRCGGRKSLKNI